IINLLDDLWSLPYWVRLIAQVVVSFMIVAAGLKVHSSEAFLEIGLTVLGFMFIINASNFIDGLNGLLSGCVFIALGFMAWMAILNDNSYSILVFLVCFELAAAILGFFFFNFPKAKIFLGDVGSTFLGLMIGILALLGQRPGET